ncbi:hypothetical protein AeRB84_014400 [Aphanomyces euteiches]|nr:hypothetical protein AeRB84_014400 [Aphanomyces euteiches]
MTNLNDLEQMFAKEIKAWKDISHEPYILTLIGICMRIPTPILVCELCGPNIRRYVRDNRETLLPMVYQLAKGLVSLHEANVIHRDLKGDNILITFQKRVAIADFGLSRTMESLEMTKSTTERCGTLNWMSPEQYLTPRKVSTKSDVWSFGMTLWEILCNDIPFRGASEFEFQNEIFVSEDDRPKKPHDLDSEHTPLWDSITKCWQLDPAARPSAIEIVGFLEDNYNSQLTMQGLEQMNLFDPIDTVDRNQD